MKQLLYKVNTTKGEITEVLQHKEINLFEGENVSTNVVFEFDRNLHKDDKLYIIFKGSNGNSTPLQLKRLRDNRFTTAIPREVLSVGKLNYAIQHYDNEHFKQHKYVPQTMLTVYKSLDISQETLNTRPDIFAEMLYRIEQLEKKIEE